MSVEIAKRSAGFTIKVDGGSLAIVSRVAYWATEAYGIELYTDRGVMICTSRKALEWTINGITGFTTSSGVCDALDAVGITIDPAGMMPAVGSNGRPNYPSDVFDTTTSATVVYEGWNQGTNYLIRKTDLSAGTRTWATGAWSSRTSLTYA